MATAVDVFNEHRGLLQAVAYRVLGRAGDTQDVVQDAWLRWSRADRADVGDPQAYLVRLTTRLAIDRLRSAQARHESYVGPWLPEPLLTGPGVAEDAVLSDTVSSAMLLVLESLSPVERAVFVLHEAFGYSYGEIARIVDRSEEAVRQSARRARQHIEDRKPRYETDPRTRRAVTERFLAACNGGDLEELMTTLAPGVTLVSDGGGLAPAPRRAITGAELVARALLAFADRLPADPSVVITDVNGGPGVVLYSAGTPVVALALHMVDGVIETIHLVSNPEKLSGLM